VFFRLTFEEWVERVFALSSPTDDCDAWESILVSDVLPYTTRLFSESGTLLKNIQDVNVSAGFWYLVGAPTALHQLRSTGWTVEERCACIRSTLCVFRDVFNTRCGRDYDVDGSELDICCHMWWDNFPTWGTPGDPALRPIDSCILDTMNEILSLDNPNCRGSALHGLGHWHSQYPQETEAIISRYLQQSPQLSPQLKSYALAARRGMVQ